MSVLQLQFSPWRASFTGMLSSAKWLICLWRRRRCSKCATGQYITLERNSGYWRVKHHREKVNTFVGIKSLWKDSCTRRRRDFPVTDLCIVSLVTADGNMRGGHVARQRHTMAAIPSRVCGFPGLVYTAADIPATQASCAMTVMMMCATRGQHLLFLLVAGAVYELVGLSVVSPSFPW